MILKLKLKSSALKTRDSYIQKLSELGIHTFEDLLLYFPRTYRDEQDFVSINEMRTDEVNVVCGTVKSLVNIRTRSGKTMTRALVADSTGEIPVMWFNQPHIKQMFFKGSEIILTGKMKYEQGRSMLMSPKYERPSATLLHTGRIVPVYPESEDITSKWLREKIHLLLPLVDQFVDPMPRGILAAEGLMDYATAIHQIHFPESEEHLNKARERLAFDELFIIQCAALKRKMEWQKKATQNSSSLIDLSPFHAVLPFTLTGAQVRVIAEVMEDISRPFPMLRLVQGDVGAGKTVIAAAAIYAIHERGQQSALMAPTEILARQHYKNLMKLLAPFKLNIQLLVGSLTQSEHADVLRQLATGTCDLVIGTHALIQEGVQFARLGLAVVDEQHRFGVKQRAQLTVHGTPHLLSLSATPIPRTLALTLYGDQDLSILDELPPGRQEIVTRIIPEPKRTDAYYWISDQVQKGRQVFIICPLIEESEVLELKAATQEFERLSKDVFPQHRLALLHGKMKAEDKDSIMKEFSQGNIDILVSTSVVEVGIDVPNASIMLIEAAERFGLAQLHQFRGRVGRGEHQSYCFLFTESSSNNDRLRAMVKHSSGFDLAEIDLKLRGPGEVYGVKQSGIPDLKMATLTDLQFVERVRSSAERYLEEDPEFDKAPHLKEKMITAAY